ncbi:MAG: cytochrome c3 family protein [Planctomycetes bacterium]|nr:cytochrome c3 family protein [Planctomycetota bacterium]
MSRIVILAMMFVGAVSMASFGGVADGPHNMSADYDIANGEVCKPCHIPHGSTEDDYLWAQQDGVAIAVRADASLGHGSLLCMSCHDGVTAISQSDTPGETLADHALGTDLTKDHPVGVDYGDSSRRAGTVPVRGGRMEGILVDPPATSPYLPLFSHEVDDGTGTGTMVTEHRIECSTCHTPHTDADSLLRAPNTGSALCVACHTSQK